MRPTTRQTSGSGGTGDGIASSSDDKPKPRSPAGARPSVPAGKFNSTRNAESILSRSSTSSVAVTVPQPQAPQDSDASTGLATVSNRVMPTSRESVVTNLSQEGRLQSPPPSVLNRPVNDASTCGEMRPESLKRGAATETRVNENPKRHKLVVLSPKQPMAGQGHHDGSAARSNSDCARSLEGGRNPTVAAASPTMELSGEPGRGVTVAGHRVLLLPVSNGSCASLGRGRGSGPAAASPLLPGGRPGSDQLRSTPSLGARHMVTAVAPSVPATQAGAAGRDGSMLHVVFLVDGNTQAGVAGDSAAANNPSAPGPARSHGDAASRAVTQRELSGLAFASTASAKRLTAGCNTSVVAVTTSVIAVTTSSVKTSTSERDAGRPAVGQTAMHDLESTVDRPPSSLHSGSQATGVDHRASGNQASLPRLQHLLQPVPPPENESKINLGPVEYSRCQTQPPLASASITMSILSNGTHIVPAARATVGVATGEMPSPSKPDVAALGLPDASRQTDATDEVINLISDDEDSDCLEVTDRLSATVSRQGDTKSHISTTSNNVISVSSGSLLLASSSVNTTSNCNSPLLLSSLMQPGGAGSTGSFFFLPAPGVVLPDGIYSLSVPSLQLVAASESASRALEPVQVQATALGNGAGTQEPMVVQPTVSAIAGPCLQPVQVHATALENGGGTQEPLLVQPTVSGSTGQCLQPAKVQATALENGGSMREPLLVQPTVSGSTGQCLQPLPPQPIVSHVVSCAQSPLLLQPSSVRPSPVPPQPSLPPTPLVPQPALPLPPPILPPTPLVSQSALPLVPPLQPSTTDLGATGIPNSPDVDDGTTIDPVTAAVQQPPATSNFGSPEDVLDHSAAGESDIPNVNVTKPCQERVTDSFGLFSPARLGHDPTERPQVHQGKQPGRAYVDDVSNDEGIMVFSKRAHSATKSNVGSDSLPVKASSTVQHAKADQLRRQIGDIMQVRSFLKILQRRPTQQQQLSSWSCRTRSAVDVRSTDSSDKSTDSGGDGMALVMSKYKFVRTPRGLTYPAPNGLRSCLPAKPRTGSSLCTCKWKLTQATASPVPVFCQARDCMEGMTAGCPRLAAIGTAGMPNLKIPVMALCTEHLQLLRSHQCCPGCGLFCVSGQFLQCRSDNLYTHLFHQSCQVTTSGKALCLHCGEESSDTVVLLRRPRNLARKPQLRLSAADGTSGPSDEVVPKALRLKATRPIVFGNTSKPIKAVAGAPQVAPAHVSAVLKTRQVLSTAGLDAANAKEIYDLAKVLEKLKSIGHKELRKSVGSLGSIYQAVRSNSINKLVCMLADDVDPNARIPEAHDGTLLHVASEHGHLVVVHCLLQVNAMPNMTNRNGSTPLMLACTDNHLSVAKHLIRAGAKVNMKDNEGQTVLHAAAKAGCLEAVQLLVSTTEIDVNIQDLGGWTALAWATENVHTAVAEYLLRSGSDPSLRDQEHNTCLHWAVYSGSPELCAAYLDAGCLVEAVNANGDRALHIASRRGHYSIVALLLARGADSNAVNNVLQMPHECTVNENIKKMLAVNQQLRSFKTSAVKFAETLLHCDISRGREHIPISCVNSVDDMNFPEDYVYVSSNVESPNLDINRGITTLQRCGCTGDCSAASCGCASYGGQCWYDEHGRLLPHVNLSESPLITECNQCCRCWMNCRNRVVQLGTRCQLQLFRTEKLGWGVRTLKDIPRGTFICEYTGEIISDHEADRRQHDSYLFDLDSKEGDTYCIDGFYYGNIGRFINHHCDPNIAPVRVLVEHRDVRFPRICFFAVRDIIASEELGFDYGDDFWFIKYKNFTCECGSSHCKFSRATIAQTMAEHGRKLDENLLLDFIPCSSP